MSPIVNIMTATTTAYYERSQLYCLLLCADKQ